MSSSQKSSSTSRKSSSSSNSVSVDGSKNATYYALPSIPISAAVFAGMYLCYHAGFSRVMPLYPQLEWLRDLGLTIFRSQEGIQYVFVLACFLHILEALAAYGECQRKGVQGRWRQMLWFIQTLAVGLPSLKLLQALPTPTPKQSTTTIKRATGKRNK